jgi:hypothetical protein
MVMQLPSVIYRNILHLYLPTTNTLILFQEYIPVMLTVMEELLLLLIIVHIYKNSHGEVGKELYETPDVQWKKITPLLF